MKYRYSLLLQTILLLFFSYSSYSQVTFGVRSGMNIATTKNLIEHSKNRIGCYGGGVVTIPIYKKLFLQAELLYSSKGYRTDEIIGAGSKSVMRFNYLNLPILFGYRIDKKTFFVFGPEIGQLLSAQLSYSSDFFDASKGIPSKFDVGLDVGASHMVIKHLNVEVRYSFGFNTLYDVDAVGNRYGNKKGANRVFQIGLSYLL